MRAAKADRCAFGCRSLRRTVLRRLAADAFRDSRGGEGCSNLGGGGGQDYAGGRQRAGGGLAARTEMRGRRRRTGMRGWAAEADRDARAGRARAGSGDARKGGGGTQGWAGGRSRQTGMRGQAARMRGGLCEVEWRRRPLEVGRRVALRPPLCSRQDARIAHAARAPRSTPARQRSPRIRRPLPLRLRQKLPRGHAICRSPPCALV
jgi:hypothetical protein